jgi:N-acetylglucosaminyldiphosphoundecaprenol N-acetyl-beta-D-mannosaminyltransferase
MTMQFTSDSPPSALDALLGRAPLVGARYASEHAPGWISPVDARLALGLAYDDPAEVERTYLRDHSPSGDLALIARTMVARAIAPSRREPRVDRPWIVSATVDNVTITEVIDRLLAPPPVGRARIAHFVHPHALNLAASDPVLRARLAAADLILPDGVGLQIASAIVGTPLTHNVNGTDLLPLLCTALARQGIPLSLVGAAPGVALECSRRLREREPDLEVAVVEDGFMGDTERARCVDRLRLAGGVVLVGMGTPLQERFAWEHLAPIKGLTALTVGGLFDFYSGRIPRAPGPWREMGVEWAWRLYQEPQRLATRYLLGNPLFVARAVAQRLRGAPPPAAR